MKLTKQQIKKIKDYLTDRDIKYIDIHFEILDHIITDIEFLIKHKGLTFEVALEKVKLKWNNSFTKKSSFLLGLAYYAPSILIDKCLKIYKPFFYKLLLMLIAFIGFSYVLNDSFSYSLANYKHKITVVISIALSFYILFSIYGYIKMKLKKVNSSYRFIYDKQFFPSLFMAVIYHPFISVNYFTKENELSYIMLGMLILFFFTALGGRYLYKKHFEAISQYKLNLN